MAAVRRSLGSLTAQACEGCDMARLLPPKLGRCWCPLAGGVQPKQDHRCSQKEHPRMLHTGQNLSGWFFWPTCPRPPAPSGRCGAPSPPCRLHAIIFLIRPGPSGQSLHRHREGDSPQQVTKALRSVALAGVQGFFFPPSRAAANSSLLLCSPSLLLTTTRCWKYEIKLIFLT